MQVSAVGEQQGATRDSARRSRGGVIRGGEWGQGLTRGVDTFGVWTRGWPTTSSLIGLRQRCTPRLLHACFLNLL